MADYRIDVDVLNGWRVPRAHVREASRIALLEVSRAPQKPHFARFDMDKRKLLDSLEGEVPFEVRTWFQDRDNTNAVALAIALHMQREEQRRALASTLY